MTILVMVILFNLLFYVPLFSTKNSSSVPQAGLTYSAFLAQVRANDIKTAQVASSIVSGDFARRYRDRKLPS
jgi:hypothetical protein